jgi:uridine phosphorylase
MSVVTDRFARAGCMVRNGSTWTTDAPFRETAGTIAARQGEGILAVEMEAAALYTFACARSRPVICLAHVTNRLGCIDGDFEKGKSNGARSSINLVKAVSSILHDLKAAACSPEGVATGRDDCPCIDV